MTDWQRVPELEADVKSGKVSLRLKDIPRGKPHIVIDPDEYADDKRIAELKAEVARLRAALRRISAFHIPGDYCREQAEHALRGEETT